MEISRIENQQGAVELVRQRAREKWRSDAITKALANPALQSEVEQLLAEIEGRTAKMRTALGDALSERRTCFSDEAGNFDQAKHYRQRAQSRLTLLLEKALPKPTGVY